MNTITSRFTQLLDIALPAMIAVGFLSVMLVFVGQAAGVMA
jgi:hypothetical protein